MNQLQGKLAELTCNKQVIQNNININPTIKKKSKVHHALRKIVWNTYIGDNVCSTKCPCCNITIISPFEFHCGHVIARSQGGSDTLDNLRPICCVCNMAMGTMDMREFVKVTYPSSMLFRNEVVKEIQKAKHFLLGVAYFIPIAWNALDNHR